MIRNKMFLKGGIFGGFLRIKGWGAGRRYDRQILCWGRLH